MKKLFSDLKSISRGMPTIESMDRLEQEMFQVGNDRAFALVFSASVEASVKRLLVSKMRSDLNTDDKRRMFENNGVLATFASCIMLSYCMDLVGSITRHDLDIIRQLRNEFAHSQNTFNFQTPEVAAICAHLQMPSLPSAHAPFWYHLHFEKQGSDEGQDLDNPKTRFASACHLISYRIHQEINGPRPGDIAFVGGPLLT